MGVHLFLYISTFFFITTFVLLSVFIRLYRIDSSMKLAVLVITWLAVSCTLMPAQMIKPNIGKKHYPTVTGATVGATYIADHRYIANYQTANASRQDITRAIIVVHGKRRDAWNYYRAVQSAVNVSTVNASNIFIIAPLFLSTWDMDLANLTSLIWKGWSLTFYLSNSVNKWSPLETTDTLKHVQITLGWTVEMQLITPLAALQSSIILSPILLIEPSTQISIPWFLLAIAVERN
jgi:hypothetical protein